MTIKFGMVMDSIDHINIQKDTSFAMLLEAQARNWELHYMQLGDLFLRKGKVYAHSQQIKVQRNAKAWYQVIAKQTIALESLDSIIMRKEPPVDQEYIYATYLLEQAERQGVYVINKPQSLRDANEKLFTAWFPQCCADTLVTRNADLIREFLAEHQDIIL
ncbi:MAG: glutathione synthase, partial [Candidatus Methanofishera endochildressiae]|nr:glutathione synthase [Candidatus Methanofishera endochildressiae]